MLVDELAHTNAPGSRHAKRWQDVLELLDAGIDVLTTLNVQHVESLNDVVAQITGVQVRETVPDSVLDRADEIELVDIAPEELLCAAREGKVYLPSRQARASEHFFQRGNLLALRELALRRTAQRVDEDVLEYREEHGVIGPRGPLASASWCAWGQRPARGASSAPRAHGRGPARAVGRGLRRVHRRRPMSDADRERLEAHLRLAESLGAKS
jgi:two-component system sensor histidine kinase KdpD